MHRNRTWQINPTELRSQRNRILLVEGGDGSILNLDFTSGILDPRLTLVRNSTLATYINSRGFVTTATTNEPRFDYSPTNVGELKGLLIEGDTVNRALRSNDFNTVVTDGSQWNPSGYTADTLSTQLPDGSTGNSRRIVMASGSGSFRSGSITVEESKAYTWSFWARNNGGSQARYRVWNASAGLSIVDYNDSASNYVSLIGGANNTSSTWVRISKTFTTPVGCTSIFVYPASSDSGSVDLLVWGAQLELGSGPSSYIPTTSSTVTRNGDFLLSASSLGAGRNTEFSLNDITIGISSLSQYTLLYVYGRDTNQKRTFPASLFARTNAGVQRLDVRDFNGNTLEIKTQLVLVANASSFNASTAKIAFSGNGVAQPRVAINGTVSTGTLGIDAVSGIQWVQLGNSSAVAGSFNPIWVKQLKIFPTTLSTAQLQALTT